MSTESGPTTAPRVVRDRGGIAPRLVALIAQARHELAVFQPQLEPALFNASATTNALVAFVTAHRHNRVRLLVEDAEQAVRDNPRVVELCRRLSDFVEMRQVGEEHRGLRELFVTADRSGYLHQSDLTRPECVIELHDRGHGGELAQRFEAMWERSEPIAAIRTAGL
jgi:hypothetical protein